VTALLCSNTVQIPAGLTRPGLLHHLILHALINMAVGKLSRGSLSHNKGYKPDGRKAYARAALKCTLHSGPHSHRCQHVRSRWCTRAFLARKHQITPRLTRVYLQTTSPLPSMAHSAPSRRWRSQASSVLAWVAKHASTAICSPQKVAMDRQAMYRYVRSISAGLSRDTAFGTRYCHHCTNLPQFTCPPKAESCTCA
jgi:hypothetical protein